MAFLALTELPGTNQSVSFRVCVPGWNGGAELSDPISLHSFKLEHKSSQKTSHDRGAIICSLWSPFEPETSKVSVLTEVWIHQELSILKNYFKKKIKIVDYYSVWDEWMMPVKCPPPNSLISFSLFSPFAFFYLFWIYKNAFPFAFVCIFSSRHFKLRSVSYGFLALAIAFPPTPPFWRSLS